MVANLSILKNHKNIHVQFKCGLSNEKRNLWYGHFKVHEKEKANIIMKHFLTIEGRAEDGAYLWSLHGGFVVCSTAQVTEEVNGDSTTKGEDTGGKEHSTEVETKKIPVKRVSKRLQTTCKVQSKKASYRVLQICVCSKLYFMHAFGLRSIYM